MKNKVVKNFFVSILSQAIILILGFVVPRIILTHYGSDINGLMNTITQIFTYMALLEAGISQASRNALYKHIIDNDNNEISVVMSGSRRYYRKISLIYLAAVVALSIVLPFILKTEISYWTIFFFVIFEGLTSVVAFYFINTWTCFLIASGKSYVTNLLSLLNKILCYGVRIILALYNINIVFIQVGYFIVSLIQLAIYYFYMKKMYNWIDYNAAPKGYKLPDRNSFIVSEIAWAIFSSTDLIILSVFVSTSLASVYSIYNMVFVALNGLLSSLYTALNYNLGQSYHIDANKCAKVYDTFNSVFVGGMTIFMCTAYWLVIPFVRLYTEGVNDINYIYVGLPLLFCLVQLFSWGRMSGGTLINAAGYARKLIKINVSVAIINIVLSIILVNFLSIFGVLLATVVALPIELIYCCYFTNKKVLNRSIWKTVAIISANYIIFAISAVCYEFINLVIDSYLMFIGYGFLLFVIFFVIIFIINCLINKDLISFILKRFFKKY